MQPSVLRWGMGPDCSVAVLPRLLRRAALGLALFMALAAPAIAQLPPTVYLSCTNGASFPPTQVCTSMTMLRGGVLLTNIGDAPLTITSLTFQGPNAGDFSVTQGCVTTIQPGQICNLIVTFTPHGAGQRQAVLVIQSNAPASPYLFPVEGTGVGSSSGGLSPSSASFGNQIAGSTSGPQTLTLTNTGDTTLNIASVSVPAPFHITAGGTPGSLAPGASRTITVTFAPTATTLGPQSAILTVVTDSVCGSFTATLTGTGTSNAPGTTAPGPPAVTLSRTYMSFADLCLGGTAGPLCFTITNTGSGPLVINSIGVANCSNSIHPTYIDCATVAGFQIISGGGAGTLAVGASRDVCLTFTPHEAATFSAFVMIDTNAAATPAVVELHGTGDVCPGPPAPPAVSLSGGSFGNQCVDTTSGAQTVTLTNTGGSDLIISSIFLPAGSPFHITSGGTPGTLAAGASRSIMVTFAPSAPGTQMADLTVVSNAASSPNKITLSAMGITSAFTATLTPGTVPFGNQLVNTTSAAQNLTLTNTSGAPLAIDSITLSAGAPFMITAGGTPTTLGIGGTRTISVVFKPTLTTLGPQSATLTVTSAALCAPLTATLTGTGMAPTGVGAVTLSRDHINFPVVCLGQTAGPLCFTITNSGTGPLTINSISLLNCSDTIHPTFIDCATVAGFKIISGGSPGVLAAGASREVCITVTPTEAATFDATVAISTDASSTPTTVSLHASGQLCPGPPAVSLTAAPFTQCVGTTGSAQTVTLKNTGTADLIITSISVPAPFHITSGGGAGTLASGATRSIMVTFAPSVAGAQMADLTVVSNSLTSPDKLTLVGTGTTAATTATLTPNSLTFTDQAVSTTSAVKTITLTNTSGAPLTINSITLAGANPGSFKITAGGGAGTLAVNGTRTISIVFQPAAGGPQTASVSLDINQPGVCTPTATLSGNGICPPLSITCPPDLMVCLSEGQCTATGVMTTPTVTPNVPSTTLACVRSDGQPLDAPYPFGTTTITCTATDACGNTARCTRRVTVWPLGQTEVSLFIAAVNGVPTLGTPDQMVINVGDCVTLKMLVTVAGCPGVLDVTGSSTFFTDPARGTFTGSTWCATAAEENTEFPIYGNFVNPCTGTELRDTVHIHVNRNDGQ